MKPVEDHERRSEFIEDWSRMVGVLGIEPNLPVPKTGVLPVYDTP